MNHGITLLDRSLANDEKANDPESERQIGLFGELRRLYRSVSASLASSSAIFLNPKCHFDLVRAGSALFGINPTPGSANPMLPVVELRARIVHVRDVMPGKTSPIRKAGLQSDVGSRSSRSDMPTAFREHGIPKASCTP